MKFGSKFNKRSDIPSFREFLSYEKIIKESGYNEDSEIEVKSNASKEQKEKYIENKLKSGHNKNTTEKQIKAINKEKYKLIKENGLLKEEIENYRKSLEKDKNLSIETVLLSTLTFSLAYKFFFSLLSL